MTTDSTFEQEGNTYELGELEAKDIPNLRPVIENWVKWDGVVITKEVDDIVKRLEGSIAKENGYTYEVIRNEDGIAIGMAGLREPEEKMLEYKSGMNAKSAELVNVFLSSEYRGKGLGYSLLNATFEKAKTLGFEEVIWNSGPRYKSSAWDFYTKVVGEPIAMGKAYYGLNMDGTGRDAPIWRKVLVNNN